MSSAHAIENKKKEISLLQFLGQNTCSLYLDEQQNISHTNAFQPLLIKAHPQTTTKDDWQPKVSSTKPGDRSANLSPRDEGAPPQVTYTRSPSLASASFWWIYSGLDRINHLRPQTSLQNTPWRSRWQSWTGGGRLHPRLQQQECSQQLRGKDPSPMPRTCEMTSRAPCPGQDMDIPEELERRPPWWLEGWSRYQTSRGWGSWVWPAWRR